MLYYGTIINLILWSCISLPLSCSYAPPSCTFHYAAAHTHHCVTYTHLPIQTYIVRCLCSADPTQAMDAYIRILGTHTGFCAFLCVAMNVSVTSSHFWLFVFPGDFVKCFVCSLMHFPCCQQCSYMRVCVWMYSSKHSCSILVTACIVLCAVNYPTA